LAAAFDAMEALERGALANPDEQRRVGHYWLRAPELAPEPSVRDAIETTLTRIRTFAQDVHALRIKPPTAARFSKLLVVGIGGSALGPQLVAHALGSAHDRMSVHFLDNTDPDGIHRVLTSLAEQGDGLAETLVLVVSKSGGTPETRNGQLETQAAFARAGLNSSAHFVAVTSEGSGLDQLARNEGWLARFPMWDWVGGRTSELSAAGLLPAALQGLDIDGLLRGARDTDRVTRARELDQNPAALLAVAWHLLGDGRGSKDMVILPYKDRLSLLSRYLQQLVMESLGKERDLDGKLVHQGLAVYGNKGSTDQHAYVQQLRDGLPNFFVTFVEVLADAPALAPAAVEVEPGVTAGDVLSGLLQGTRRALWENGRESLTLTIDSVTPYSVGVLLALYERAVGLYASLVNINAYHQPGVEAGKKAAAGVLALQGALLARMRRGGEHTAVQWAQLLGLEDGEYAAVFRLLEHLAANGRVHRTAAAHRLDARFAAP
jgi:glucose-6-phosphate isomerase